MQSENLKSSSSVRDHYRWGVAALTAQHFSTASLDVACLLVASGAVSDISQVFAASDLPMPAKAGQRFMHLLQRRKQHEPIAYLIGKKEFFGREFVVDNRVLIPRPDSELLVEVALQQLPAHPVTVVDIGTGSGCLAISCALQRPDCHYLAIDKSSAALAVAKINASRYACRNIIFQQRDVFAATFKLPSTCALLISNPPYISSAEMPSLPRSVYNYEPHSALRADNLCFYQRLADLTMCYNKCRVLVEISSDQLQAVVDVFALRGIGLMASYNDLAGLPRACLF